MKRCIMTAPEAVEWDDLTDEQQAEISGIFSQWVMPMPGTVSSGGLKIIDAVMSNTFDPAKITELALPLTIIGLWQWDGGEVAELITLASSFWDYLAPIMILDDEEVVIGTEPAPHSIPHGWSGWPDFNDIEAIL